MTEKWRVIFHVDLDAFYASIEVARNSALRGKPVVIGADPEDGRGRGVVVACSYEARKYGLRSGMPISRAYRICPQATYLRPEFPFYARSSSRIMERMRKYADSFEQVSIDEAFLDVSSKVNNTEEISELSKKIKDELFELEGLTCSIGVGPSKSSAKIASDIKKPDGLTIVPFEHVEEFLAPLPTSAIPGIGKKNESFLEEKGVHTIRELQSVPGKQLIDWFGKGGVWLWGVIHGKEEIPVKQREIPNSLNVERTFRRDIEDFSLLYDELETISSELHRRLELGGFEYKTVGIKIRFSGFATHTREKSFPEYSDSKELILSTAKVLLKEFEEEVRPIRLLGTRVSGFRPKTTPSSLDNWVQSS